MPETVTAWPVWPDPRDAAYSIIGYVFGMVAPNQFSAKTTGALAPFTELNDGVLLTGVTDTGANTFYSAAGALYTMTKVGFPVAQVGPPNWSVELIFTAIDLGGNSHDGTLRLLFPKAIREYSFTVDPIGVGPDLIPNPVVLSPRNFSATS